MLYIYNNHVLYMYTHILYSAIFKAIVDVFGVDSQTQGFLPSLPIGCPRF